MTAGCVVLFFERLVEGSTQFVLHVFWSFLKSIIGFVWDILHVLWSPLLSALAFGFSKPMFALVSLMIIPVILSSLWSMLLLIVMPIVMNPYFLFLVALFAAPAIVPFIGIILFLTDHKLDLFYNDLRDDGREGSYVEWLFIHHRRWSGLLTGFIGTLLGGIIGLILMLLNEEPDPSFLRFIHGPVLECPASDKFIFWACVSVGVFLAVCDYCHAAPLREALAREWSSPRRLLRRKRDSDKESIDKLDKVAAQLRSELDKANVEVTEATENAEYAAGEREQALQDKVKAGLDTEAARKEHEEAERHAEAAFLECHRLCLDLDLGRHEEVERENENMFLEGHLLECHSLDLDLDLGPAPVPQNDYLKKVKERIDAQRKEAHEEPISISSLHIPISDAEKQAKLNLVEAYEGESDASQKNRMAWLAEKVLDKKIAELDAEFEAKTKAEEDAKTAEEEVESLKAKLAAEVAELEAAAKQASAASFIKTLWGTTQSALPEGTVFGVSMLIYQVMFIGNELNLEEFLLA